MKKTIGAFCSILAGVLTFVFFSIPNIVSTLTVALLGSATAKETAWDVLKNYDSNTDGYVLFKIAVIAMIVFACLAIIVGTLLLLKNFNEIKTKINFNLANNIVLCLLMVANIVAFISSVIICNFLASDAYLATSSAKIGVGLWLNLIFSVVAFVIALIFAKPVKNKKKSKK